MRRNAGLRDQQSLALYFPLSNMKGIEIDPFAVQLARVTLWMGHKLAVEELDIHEEVLPLTDLSGFSGRMRLQSNGRERMRSSATRRTTAHSDCAANSVTTTPSG
jgi:hypothetical protein